MNFKSFSRFFSVFMVLVWTLSNPVKAQFGDYSVQIEVENSSQTYSHFTNVIFANSFFGGTPSNGWDVCCDAFSLPPASGQPMVYTSITEAPFPTGTNELQFNTRPPLATNWSVPLGFDAGAGVTDGFTFTARWLHTLPASVGVELEDLQTSTTQDLLADSTYTFTGSHSDSEARFMLHFTVAGACSSPEPAVASNIGTEQFDVSWTCNNCSGGETFIVEYGAEGFTPGTNTNAGAGGTVVNPATSPLTISGLDPETVYYVYVRAVCSGPAYSSNAGPTEVETVAAGCPDPTMVAISSVSQSGAQVSWLCNSCTGSEAFVIEYGPTGFVPGTDDNAGGGSVIYASASPETLSGLTPNTTYDVYIRTKCSSIDHSANTTVQTFTTDGIPCAVPENVSVTNVDGYQADVNWTCNGCAGGEQFIVEYGPNGFTPGTEATAGTNGTVITPATSAQNISLQPSTQYDVYVRTVCGGGNYSSNSSVVSFLSGVACEAPDLPTVLNVTGTTADVSWTCNSCYGIGETFSIEYGPFDFPTTGDPFVTVDPATSTHALTGLSAGTQYSLRVRAYCGQGNYSAYTSLAHFTTTAAASCSASATTGSSSTCVNSDVSFTDSSTGATTWFWDFGDGTTSTMQNPVHAYQDTGTFDVMLTVTDGGSCTDDTTFSAAVTVNSPVAEFALNPSGGCAIPHTVFYTDQSTLPDTWLWDFGDGNTSTLQNPVHNYTTTGDFNVLLTVTDTIHGCSDTASSMVHVSYPIADFAASTNSGCIPLDVQFTDNSQVFGPDSIVSWAWDFENGDTSTDQNPLYTFTEPGVFNISLTVTTSLGCTSTHSGVFVNPSGLVADFGPDTVSTGCLPLSVTFTDSTLYGIPASSQWIFGDGNSSATVGDVSHTYTSGGSFDVTLIVSTAAGCSDTLTKVAAVVPDVSTVSIVCPGSDTATTCTYSLPDYAASAVATDPCDPTPTVWQSIGAGTEINQSTVVWVYAQNASGGIDSCDVNVTLQGSNLSAGCQAATLSLDSSGSATIDFDATANADQGNANSNGSTAGTNFYQSFQPGQNGIINQIDLNIASISSPTAITLNLYDGVGTGGTLLHSQPVANIPGAVSIPITGIIQLTMGADYTFELNVTGGGNISLLRDSGNPYGSGDSQDSGTDLLFETHMLLLPVIESGSTSCEGIAEVALSQSSFNCSDIGTANVDMTLTDHQGNTSLCTSAVTVEDNIAPVAVCQPFTLSLDSTGSGSITASDINGGSSDNCGIASMSVSPSSFTCADIGTHTVVLTVVDSAGLADTCSTTITVQDITPPELVCQDIQLYLNGSGITDSASPSTWPFWTVSDNCGLGSWSLPFIQYDCSDLGSNLQQPFYHFDINGNVDTCLANVTVLDTIAPTITCPADVTICADNPNGAVVTYTTPTGSDNCTATVSQIDVTGLSSGSVFPVGTTTLTYMASDASSNSATCSFDITILPTPDASFSNTAACLGETIFFTDESTIDTSGSIVSWQWDMGDGSSQIGIVDPTHVYAATGTYTVSLTVESSNGCTDTYSATIEVTEVPTADYSATTECQGTATSFTNASTIAPSYSGNLNYVWDFGDGNTSTDSDPTHLFGAAGTYTVMLTVTTDDGCEDVISNSITVLEQPTALFVSTEACLGDSTVFTNLSVGTGLTFAWDFGDGNTSTDPAPAHTYAGAGTYTVSLTATNGDGCAHTSTMMVTVNENPSVGFTFTNECEGNEGMFTNTSDAGSYAWDFGDGNSSILQNPPNTYANSGTYDVTLVVTNSNGCTDQLTQPIEIFDNPEFTLTATDALCHGDSTGSILVSPSIGAAPLDFILDGGTAQISSTFSNLMAGNYTITILDANGCETSDDVTVSQPVAPLGVTVNGLIDILCHGDTTGIVEVSGTGGTSPYTFTLNGGASQPNGQFSGLMAGTHDLNITDDNGCTFDTTLTLTEPDTLELMVDSVSHLLCNGDSSGWISVSGMGGVMPYEYSIDGTNFDTPAVFSGLSAGVYTLMVLDANGCTDTVNVTVTEPGVLMLSLIGTEDALCFGQANGSVTVAATSGTAPYEYSIDGGINWQASGSFLGITAGTYNVLVMDANGCMAEVGATVNEPTAITVATATTPVLCLGDSTGTIDITAAGGTPSYLFSIDGGDSFATAASYSALPAGNYVVVVQDSLGCTASESVVISQPSNPLFGTALIQEIGCFGDSTGIIEIQATGGTGSYSYSIDGGANWQVSDTYENLPAGTYAIIIQDVNGCTFTVDVEVEAPSEPLTISEVLLSPPSCPGEDDGSLTIVASGGTPSYQYSTDGGANFITTNVFTGAMAGSYELVLMDDNGCTAELTAQINDPDSIVVTVDTVVIVNCEGENYGEVHVTATGGTGEINYQLNGGPPQTSGSFTGLSDGMYVIEATDAAGCSGSVTIDGSAPNPLPDPNFTYVAAGTTVSFTNTSLEADTFSWDFGDGSGTSTDLNPSYTYGSEGTYDVILSATNDCGTVDTTITINTNFVGVEDIEMFSGLNLFPNPTSGEVNLTFDLTDHIDQLNLEVFDVRGRSVYHQSRFDLSGTQNFIIDLDNASEGVYRMRLITGNHNQVIKFVITR